MATTADEQASAFSFLKGQENVIAPKDEAPFDWEAAAAVVRGHLRDAMNAQNLGFLLGSGCSSLVREGVQLGIPTMAPMAQAFLNQVGPDDTSPYISQVERQTLLNFFGLEVTAERFLTNLERLMESLYGASFALRDTTDQNAQNLSALVNRVISKIARHVLTSCTTGPFVQGDKTVLNLYQAFYQKLLLRDRSLPRPWVFTTNYDLFNETAMDRRSIPYCNGFQGVVERRFNPAVFRYALAEQLDISSRKWSAVDSFVYLCKLHGSVNWIEDGDTLFPVRELQNTPTDGTKRVLVYPTPAKQSASFAFPYADLFREFQNRIVRDQSVLVVIGYSFGDEHINNIIFQALTIPNFRLIAFLPPDAGGIPAQLRELLDPRIWMIGGGGPKANASAHYFDTFVERFMPDLPGQNIEQAVEKVVQGLLRKSAETNGGSGD
jgi:hypothetical protein